MIYNDDCILATNKIRPETIDLMICDPPFGLNETKFQQQYKRNPKYVVNGYKEAPSDRPYYQFTSLWLSQARRVIKPNGSMYLFSGWTNLHDVLHALEVNGWHIINHLIWHFNFAPYTKTKYVSSHYHILYVVKNKKAKPIFNTFCRFGPQEKDLQTNRSLVYHDLHDVFNINREYHREELKNCNKLPDELIQKIILYSSNPGDVICDFFLGNFTTAIVAKKLGRIPYGFEINQKIFEIGTKNLRSTVKGSALINLKKVNIIQPKNQGKTISETEMSQISSDYQCMIQSGMKVKDAYQELCKKYQRGRFSIKNILDRCKEI